MFIIIYFTHRNRKVIILLAHNTYMDSRGRQGSSSSPVIKERPLSVAWCMVQLRVPLTVSFTLGSRRQAHNSRLSTELSKPSCSKQGPCNDLAGLRPQHFDTRSVTLSGKSSESWSVRFRGRAVSGAGL